MARFGVTIYFGKPEKKEFQEIVRRLAKRAGLEMPEEELLLEANKRLDDNGNKETVSYDSVMKHLGISEAELLEAEDADIE